MTTKPDAWRDYERDFHVGFGMLCGIALGVLAHALWGWTGAGLLFAWFVVGTVSIGLKARRRARAERAELAARVEALSERARNLERAASTPMTITFDPRR